VLSRVSDVAADKRKDSAMLGHLGTHSTREIDVRFLTLAKLAFLAALVLAGAGAAPARAATVCSSDGDTCVVVPDILQTPIGPATITVNATNQVIVQLAPTMPNTIVLGFPVTPPPGPSNLPGYARSSIDTAGGVVSLDTVQIPPGPPSRPALPSLAIVSIHPPGPCRVFTSGTTVVFTPISR
jgi:hypothetical protein